MGGRKKNSKVWKYFEYNEDIGKSVCQFVDENSNTNCGVLLMGKNTTNLIAHLRRLHKVNVEEFKSKEKAQNGENIIIKQNNNQNMLNKIKTQKTMNHIKVETTSHSLNYEVSFWSLDSEEYKGNFQNVVDFVIESGSPVTVVDMPSFKKMIQNLQPKFKPPCSVAVKKKMEKLFMEKQKIIKFKLDRARKVCVCIDAWSTKGTCASFFGISACFYDNTTRKSVHVILNFKEMIYPQTEENIFNLMEKCLLEWNIPQQKVLQFISDNGSNILKTTTNLKMKYESSGEDVVSEDEDEEDEDDVSGQDQLPELKNQDLGPFDFLQLTTFYHLPCLANTIYLLVRPVYVYYNSLLTKAWQLVHWIRTSEIMKELLIIRCGKSVVSNCMARCNSTYVMTKALISIKMDINHVMENQGVEFLSASEWSCLDEIYTFLEPFASQTELLQNDCMSLSVVLPSILNLECHLQQSTAPSDLCDQLSRDLRKLFTNVLDPTSVCFNPLPAAACLLDPSVRDFILAPELDNLLQEAKKYIYALDPKIICSVELEEKGECGNLSARKQFKFLASKMKVNSTNALSTSLSNQLSHYVCDSDSNENDVLQYWLKKETTYSVLSQIAEDLVSVPASQAFLETISTFFKNMSYGRKHQMHQFSEIRAFLQMNNKIEHVF